MSVLEPTVAGLTARALLGRRRSAVLLLLPLVVLALCGVVRAVSGPGSDAAVDLLDGVALGTLVPLVGVIVGTGAIGPEIEDGSIVYLLAKPIDRLQIVLSKLVVAVAVCWLFAALPVLVAGLVLVGGADRTALGFAVAASAASAGYAALFLLLGVVTRNAVLVGLLYALLWETTVAGVVPGARALSVRQWALSLTEQIAPSAGVDAAVGVVTGAALLLVLVVAATVEATRRLRRLTLTGEQ